MTDEKRYISLLFRFWSRVDFKDGCWEWLGTCYQNGYGQLRNENSVIESAHRLSWRIHFGEIELEKCICHSCDNRICVNPKHLWLGTLKENSKDAVSKGRHISGFKLKPNAVPHGVNHHCAKLNPSLVSQIKQLRSENMSYREIGDRFCVNPQTVWNAVNKRSWKGCL